MVTQVFAAVELHAKQRKKAKQIRYNTILAYMKQIVDKKYDSIKDKPRLNTAVGLLKSDLLAIVSIPAHVLDTQVVSEHVNLNVAHKSKVEKYEPLDNAIKHRYDVTSVSRSTANSLSVVYGVKHLLTISLLVGSRTKTRLKSPQFESL